MFPGVRRWLYAHASFTPVKGKACVGGWIGRERGEGEGWRKKGERIKEQKTILLQGVGQEKKG